MKFILFFLLTLLANDSYCSDGFRLNNIEIIYNIDSLENEILKNNKSNQDEYLKMLFKLEYSRFFFSSNTYGNSLNEINTHISNINSKYLIPYYNLFLSINNFNHKTKLDSTLNLLYSCVTAFEKNNDTVALMLTYSRLIDLQMIYKNKLDKANSSLLDFYYNKCSSLASNTNSNYSLLYYYFISIRYYFYYKMDSKKMNFYSDRGINLCYDSRDKNFVPILSYFYRYKGLFFSEISKADSAITYFKKAIHIIQNPQSSNSINCYLLLVNQLNAQKQFDSANVYLNIIEKNIKNNVSLNEIGTYYAVKSQFFWNKKEYANAWDVRNKYDSIHQLIDNENYKIPMQQLNEEYKVAKIKIENEEAVKKNSIAQIVILSFFIVLIVLLFFYVLLKRKNIELIKLNEFKKQIHTIISHDFRSPLYALQGLYDQAIYLLKHNKLEELKLLSENIDNTSAQMGNLLNNLLAWSNQNTHNSSVEKVTTINLNAEIKNTLDLYQQIIQNKNVTVLIKISDNLMIKGNPNVVDLLIRNWLDNSLKYANPTNIEIIATQLNNKVTVSMIDNGIIATNTITQIQQQLCNKNNSIINETSRGLGLGLMVYFAKQQGWILNLQTTERKNEFSIVIPS